MKKKIAILFSVLLTVALIILPITSCSSPEDTTTGTTPFTQLQSKVATLESKVAGLETAIANVGTPVALTSKVNILEGSLVVVKSDIADLEIKTRDILTQEDIEAVQDSVGNLVDQVDSFIVQLAGVGAKTVANLNNIEALQDEYDSLVVELVDIRALIEAIDTNGDPATEPEGYQDLIGDVAGLKADVSKLEASLVRIDGELDDFTDGLSDIESDIVGILATLEDIDDSFSDIADYFDDIELDIDYIEDDIDNINDQIDVLLETPRVTIDKVSGSRVDFTVETTGEFVVIFSLYRAIGSLELEKVEVDLVSGTSDSSITITELLYWYTLSPSGELGDGELKVILEPKYGSWVEGNKYELWFGGLNVDYVEVTTGYATNPNEEEE